MTTSVKEQILVALETLFTGVDASLPEADPYGVEFSVVTRKPIQDGVPKGKKSVLGIYDGRVSKRHEASFMTKAELPVVIEFHLYVGSNESSTTLINQYFTAVERILHADQTLGGLCVNIVMDGEEPDIDGLYDKHVSGAMFITIQYRYQTGDPRSRR